MSISEEKRQGHGKLRNCIFPSDYFKVEYGFRQTAVIASANRSLAKHLGNIEYIRVLDGARVPNGIYNLELDGGQTAEVVRVRKRLDNWELLPI